MQAVLQGRELERGLARREDLTRHNDTFEPLAWITTAFQFAWDTANNETSNNNTDSPPNLAFTRGVWLRVRVQQKQARATVHLKEW